MKENNLPTPDTLKRTRNLLLDLGGVLYGVDYTRTVQALQALAASNGMPPVQYSQAMQEAVFDQFEMGKISPEAFRAQLRPRLGASVTDAELDTAWNAMLLGPLPGRVELLQSLRASLPVALLSNTNAIHWAQVGHEIDPFRPHLDQVLASYALGMRKPNADIFLHALAALGWHADETLFVDDSIQHVHGAQAVGLHAWHLQDADDLFRLRDVLVGGR